MRLKNFLTGCAVVAMGGAANAGGYVEPIVEVTETVVAPIVTDWAGAYVGGSIGYAFGADDEIGLNESSALGQVDLDGFNAGLHVGYRWQRDSWVFGPELWLEGGKIDATDSVSFGEGTSEVTSEVNHILGLQFKTGYVVNPQTLVYGTAGFVRGDFDYTLDDDTQGYTANGYSLGLGAERKLRDNLSVFAEWQYRSFGRTDINFDGEVATRATPEHHNLKLGVNFRF